MKRYYILIGLLFCLLSTLAKGDEFYVSDIRAEGLQRVSAKAVFNALPINIGDLVDEAALRRAMRQLFRTGNFSDLSLEREGDVLIVKVVERPSISKIELEGNKTIDEEALLEGLKQSGLAEGEVFRRANLERINLELERQYISQGRYGAKVETEVEEEPRNRVALKIHITEGDVAGIRHINIVGNKVYDDKELRSIFELKTPGFWSFFKKDDKYAREKLGGDLETLRSYYMDRGYINFTIESTQVSVSPDKQHVYITINVSEGERFKVNSVDLAGDLPLEEERLLKLILIREGGYFSNRLVSLSSDLLSKRLGNEGFIFSKVNGFPSINQEERTVDITFFIDPGLRSYVRRINFVGNTSTADLVLRREMRQLEGGWASGQKIERSKVRLNQLGFFKEVNVETPRVPGSADLIDVNYVVEEGTFGELGASLGYSGGQGGLVFSLNLSQSNFMGSGNRVSVSLNHSDFQDNYNFSFDNPYYTVDGVSRGYNLFFKETNYEEGNGPNTVTNSKGGNITFGYPINEHERLKFALGYSLTEIIQGSNNVLVAEIADFLSDENEFGIFNLSTTWVWSTLNRGLFPTDGASQQVNFQLSFPGASDLEFYKLSYTGQVFFPISDIWTLRFRTELGFGDGYGDTNELPFFQNFRSGGFGSVRGYRQNTLGPESAELVLNSDSGSIDAETDLAIPNCDLLNIAAFEADPDGDGTESEYCLIDRDPFGGNALVEGSIELVFPTPFVKDKRSVRTAFFVDAGNVFDTDRNSFNVATGKFDGDSNDFDFGELRYSVGVGLTWMTAIAPLSFVIAQPFGNESGDSTKKYQFELGRVF